MSPPGGQITMIDLSDHSATFTIQWYNPRTGSKITITGPGSAMIGSPPNSADKDWVALIKRK